MPHNRFYSHSALEVGRTVLLDETEYRHLCHAMRARVGDRVELVDGAGHLAHALIDELDRKQVGLIVEEIIASEPAPQQLILALALTRPSHLEWAIEKGTELGAGAFWLF